MYKVAILQEWGGVYSSYEKNRSTSEIYNASGLFVDLVSYLMESTNSSFQFIEADGYGGDIDSAGSITGAVGQLYRGEADVAALFLSVTNKRSQYISYLHPVIVDKLVLVMSKNAAIAAARRPYILASFTSLSWLLILSALIITALASHVLVKLSRLVRTPEESSSNLPMKSQSGCGTWLDVFYRMTLEQGLPLTPKFPGLRVILACYWMSSLILAASYSGQLTAISASPRKLEIPINTLDELADSDYKLIVMEGNSVGHMLQEASPRLRDKIQNQAPTHNTPSFCDMLRSNPDKAVIKSKLSVLELAAVCKKLHNDCDLLYSDNLYLTDVIAFGIQKNISSAHRQIWNSKIVRMLETGLFHHDLYRTLPRTTCPQTLPADTNPNYLRLDLEDLQSVFIVWLLGSSGAIIILILEVSVKHYWPASVFLH